MQPNFPGDRKRENEIWRKIMNHFEQTIGIIIASIAVVLSYCGLAAIGILSKIIDFFA